MYYSARPPGRARIETHIHRQKPQPREIAPALRGGRGLKLTQNRGKGNPDVIAPALRGGRGLKPDDRHNWKNLGTIAPALRGGRGLKLHRPTISGSRAADSARPPGRARIETTPQTAEKPSWWNSARPPGRARIETAKRIGKQAPLQIAPALRGGRGLKH